MGNMTTNSVPGTIQLGAGLRGKVHYENPTQEGGDAATLCGRGADRLHSMPGREADCKACVKAWEKMAQAPVDQAIVERGLARNAREAARSRAADERERLGAEIHAAHRAGQAYPVGPTATCTCGRSDSIHYAGCPVLVAAYEGRTVDGHKITDGMAVWDYNVEVGRVDLGSLSDDGWFRVRVADDRHSLMNAQRVSVRKWGGGPLAGDVLSPASAVEVSPTVTIQGSHVHAKTVPCGRVYDDERVHGVDTTDAVTCPGCLSQPTEVLAGDGSMIRVGSRVTVTAESRLDGKAATGTVESLADYHEGEWIISITVRTDDDRKPWGFYPASLATLTESEPEGLAEWERELLAMSPGKVADDRPVGINEAYEAIDAAMGAAEWPTVGNAPRARKRRPAHIPGIYQENAHYGHPEAVVYEEEPAPVVAPKTEAQRRAVRVIAWAQAEGTTPVITSGTLGRLINDRWVADRTLRLTADARTWLASEHTAEVAPYVLDSGVTVYGATCNCGPGQENPRMRRVPWSSGGCVTAEDAIAVALGHGEVSRPHYVAPAVDEPVVIDEASTAPGFKIDFGPEITGPRRGVGRITAEDAEMLSGEPMPLVIMHPVTIEEPLTVADVVDLMTPAEAVRVLHERARRWDRRRKPSTSGNRRSRSRRA